MGFGVQLGGQGQLHQYAVYQWVVIQLVDQGFSQSLLRGICPLNRKTATQMPAALAGLPLVAHVKPVMQKSLPTQNNTARPGALRPLSEAGLVTLRPPDGELGAIFFPIYQFGAHGSSFMGWT